MFDRIKMYIKIEIREGIQQKLKRNVKRSGRKYNIQKAKNHHRIEERKAYEIIQQTIKITKGDDGNCIDAITI